MFYYSTRDINKEKKYTSAEVIKKGLADDGGLFVPETIPSLSADEIQWLCKDEYPVRAAKILSRFLTDYTYEELLEDCTQAYHPNSFVGGTAPLTHIKENLYTLELWHGPTAAFKDMALQLMPRLLSRALIKTGETRTALILVATSGDTGKAALEGYKDIPGVKIMVFYPADGVSRVQKLQMATQTGNNVRVCAVKGNFDDTQSGVKKIFSDEKIAGLLNQNHYFLSSANSINWGRLAPQIVYYVSAYCDLLKAGTIQPGEVVNVCVPTGNFGNIFAAYIAKRMGLPLGKLVCASNSNNVLTDFFKTGVYNKVRPFHLTMSPSMDILISSNLERLLYFCAGAEKTREYMKALAATGAYKVDGAFLNTIDSDFVGYYADESNTADTIRRYFFENNQLIDTHTAVGCFCAEQYRKEQKSNDSVMVVASTASPYKFASDVYTSLTGTTPSDDLAALTMLSQLTQTEIPYPLCGLGERAVRFTEIIPTAAMPEKVLAFAGEEE